MSSDSRKLSNKATGIVGVAVMCSRLLGLAREVVFNAMFGAGGSLDMFITAFRAPNLLRDLFAEGALSTAFVTTFSKKIATEGDESAWRLANKVATLTLIVMSGITLLGIACSGPLIGVLGSGFSGEKAVITSHLTAIMFPFILMVSLAALVMGMLNAKLVFGWPAMASTFFNIGSILGGIGFAYYLEPQKNWMHPHFGPPALVGLAIGTLLGGFLQLIVQFPSLRRIGFRFRFDFNWRDEGVATVLRIMAPAVIAASAVQVNVMVNTSFATHLLPGSVVWLNNAFRLMQLPLGIFGVAIGTVTLPLLSKSVALGLGDEFRSTLARGMRLAFLLTVPSSIGLIMLARPIMSLVYQHGNVTALQVEQMAGALQLYAIGLASYSVMKVLTPAFYAIDRRKTPMIISFVAIGTNLLMNWIFTFQLGWGHRGLAFSTSLVATINFVILYVIMQKQVSGLESKKLAICLVKIAVAGTLLALVCALGNYFIDWDRIQFILKLAALVATIVLGVFAFFTTAILLRIEELQDVQRMIARKFARR